jgi:hypothetical protein
MGTKTKSSYYKISQEELNTLSEFKKELIAKGLNRLRKDELVKKRIIEEHKKMADKIMATENGIRIYRNGVYTPKSCYEVIKFVLGTKKTKAELLKCLNDSICFVEVNCKEDIK